jgi:hypothetical protein
MKVTLLEAKPEENPGCDIWHQVFQQPATAAIIRFNEETQIPQVVNRLM